MPLPIKVNGNNGEVAYFKLENTINNQYFTLPISFSVSSVEFNYEYQILESNSIVQQDNSLSTQEIKGNSEILIYPNPAHNEISIQGIAKTLPFKLFFSTGQLVQKGIYLPKATIDISHLEKGTYIIEINSEKLKFIKNK
jgi:hypothetical protein